MATIAKNEFGKGDVAELVFTTLTGTDDLVYNNQRTEILILQNTTGSDVTVTVDGSGATTANCPGIGDIDVSAGKELVVTASGSETISIASISAYLSGTVAVTGGTGVNAAILSI